ncbi:recombinase family protein [Bacillus massiliigorillae]|uniref:recombinase family protein n=1 Tax=Bacillus massiliigorillae TaxID=1243664 RepID=UPI0003A12D40|nr:recombinase family protein [Bacillus massiliigorillae]
MNHKYHVFFRRVSSANQDLETQIEFDRPFREACDEDKILIIDEDATSANKLRIDQRPKIMEVLELIEADNVDTVYAYDRTRLFRDYYEAQDFCQACIEHEVKIIFTSTSNGHIPFTGDIFMEGILNLFGDIEGKNIARRTDEARRKYPPKKYGYRKTNDKKYQKVMETKQIIEEFFEEIQEIHSLKSLISFLKKYRQSLGKGRMDKDLLRMATDPFYAGYDLHGGEFHLPHVDPFLSKESFLQIQKQLVPVIEAYESHLTNIQSLYTSLPKCGYCHKTLKPKLTADRSVTFMSCSSRHIKVYYETKEINAVVLETIKQVLNQLDADKLIFDSNAKMKEIRKTLKEEINKTKREIQKASDAILFSENDSYNENWEENEQYKTMQELHKVYRYLEEELREKHKLLIGNQQLYQLTIESLENQAEMNISALTGLLINEVRLFAEKIEIDVNKFDYLRDFNTEIIIQQEAFS